MTTWQDYQATPGDNNSPPPVGAPEGMPPSSVNDIMREMMSVIQQLGQSTQDTFADLGTMAQQNANAVAITGGSISGVTLAGDGGGIWDLQAPNLVGIVPQYCLSGYYDIGVTHAISADQLGGIPLNSLVPIGIIVNFYGDITTINSTIWAVCDGTRGTPDLRNRFVRGAQDSSDLTYRGTSTAVTDQQGSHSHTGATQSHTLIPAELPPHTHYVEILAWDRGGGSPGFIGPGTGNSGYQQFLTDGGNVANLGHSHAISSDGVHGHNVTVDPPSFGLWFIMRVA